MYQPGGARFRLLVTVTVRVLPLTEFIVRFTNRCSASRPWVVAIGLIRLTHRMLAVDELIWNC